MPAAAQQICNDIETNMRACNALLTVPGYTQNDLATLTQEISQQFTALDKMLHTAQAAHINMQKSRQ